MFPFYAEGVLTYVKFRKPHKPSGKERKEWQESGTCPILFGMQHCVPGKPLVIVEGQMDALSLAEAGVSNVVSVPCGSTNLDWIKPCWEFLEKFKRVILFGDNDSPGRKMVQDVAKRLDESRCSLVESYPVRPDGEPTKDANEIIYFLGAEVLRQTLDSAQPMPVKGVIQLADILPCDTTSMPRIKTMLPTMDETLGGFMEGGLTVFTGQPGSGKSVLSGLLLLSAIQQGYAVCAYSGELTKERFQEWVHFQAAGSAYIGLKHDPVRNKPIPYVPYLVKERINAYCRDKFWLFDNKAIFENNQAESILRVFSMVARRYGCRLFLVDNMMTSLSDSDDDTRAQTKFANMLKKFAVHFEAHVVLVAHPRKTKAGQPIQGDDIGGSSATYRLADNAIVVEKPNLRIIKNRDGGICTNIDCSYAPDSRRLYETERGDLFKFDWDITDIPLAEPRADSLPEFAIRTSQNDPF